MRYTKIKRVIGLVALLTFAGVAGLGSSGGSTPNHDNDPPSNEAKESARKTRDLLHSELVAALFQEFNETTPENAEQGKQAISLIFNNANRDMRLIGVFPPLQGGFNDLPSDSFERKSLALALQGVDNKAVERIGDQWYYRTSFPLSNTFHTSCVICHSNFTPQFFSQTHNDEQWVGALMLRVPIKED